LAANFWSSWSIVSQLIFTAWWKTMSWWIAILQGECLMFGLMLLCTAHSTAYNAHCMSVKQSEPEKVIVRNISPTARWTPSMTQLLFGFLMVVTTRLTP
jgi:hypothetical protein